MSDDRKQGRTSGRQESRAAAVRVECYAGYRADEAPRRFFIGRREIGVVEIIDRWLDPRMSHIKVRGDDGGIYILRHDQEADSWDMILFDSNTRAELRLSST